MKLVHAIQQMQQLAQTMPDAELILFDRTRQVELYNDADRDLWDFEITRGDNEIVIEFN